MYMPFYLNGLRYRPRQHKRSYSGLIILLLVVSIAGNIMQWTFQKDMRVQLNNALISTDSTLAARHEAEQKLNKISEELEQNRQTRRSR